MNPSVPADFRSPSPLAPLQRVMLRDSIRRPSAGHHIEQLEIVFAPQVGDGRVVAAWRETVVRTEALRVAFVIEGSEPCGMETVARSIPPDQTEPVPASLEAWLQADRMRPLLVPHEVPWRAVFWPQERRFVWTFHHALLDGRSITRILRNFLDLVAGGDADVLAISRWRPPSPSSIARAGEIFAPRPSPGSGEPVAEQDGVAAIRYFGADFLKRLEALASEWEITAATVLTWAWGQALLSHSGADAIWVEQLRAGEPQAATAGFSMNLLPVLIHRGGGDVADSLRCFRKHLLDLRAIETVSATDFPPGMFPDVNGRWASVIMIERGELDHMLGSPDQVERLKLHEHRSDSLAAAAHLLPHLRLEVEGPGRHALLAAWIGVLEKLERGIHPA